MPVEEKRTTPRRRALKGAHIVFNDGHSTFDCQVRNLSDGGALLLVNSPVGIPGRFVLVFDDGHRHPCLVAWRSSTRIGVAFDR